VSSRKIKRKKKNSKSHQKNSKRKPSVMIGFLIIGCVVISICIYLFVGEKHEFISNKSTVENGEASSKNISENMHYDFRRLIGRWLRPDGGYVIDVRKIDASGKVDAGYYNPQPINVSRAEAIELDAGIKLFIELQDVGYPGSTYSLIYNPQKDMMFGLYYQATMKQNFEVVFVRTK
jgi:hypothetical protein